MKISRTVVVGVVGGALAAWFAAASPSGTRPREIPPAPKSSTADKTGAELAEEIGRLHERLHPTAAPQQPARDLFEYGAAHVAGPREPSPPAAVERNNVDPSVAADASAAPVSPSLTLIGIADDAGVRTAILSGAGQLSLVKEGEHVDRYTVAHIDAGAVELVDADGTGSIRLELK